MNHCSTCNNELITGARFCNICGTPVPAAPAAPETPVAPVEPTGLKRTINPEIRRMRPSRGGKTTTDLLASEASQVAMPVTSGTLDKVGESAGSDTSEPKAATELKQNAPRLSHPYKPPVIPKTTIEFTSVKVEPAGEKQKPAPPDDTPQTTAQSKEGDDVAPSPLPDSPTTTPTADEPAPDKPALSSPAPASTDPDKTVPLPPPPALSPQERDKTVPLPPPNAGASRVPGIIRPIVTSASLRQNTPIPRGQTPPNPMSPLPALPNTPPVTGEKRPQADNARFASPVNTPPPGSRVQDNQRQAEGFQSGPVPPRQQDQPAININSAGQQTRFAPGTPQPQASRTPRPSLHEMPTNYIQLQNENGNGNSANSTANRQELPLFSPESFAYTSKAAQHWRNSWRDLQNVEAGPAEDVSKGQAAVPAPLANRKDSFLRLRAIRSKQNQDTSDRNFGFWVTLFLMICLIGGLAAYIVYSYLPNTSGAVSLTQPAGSQQPSFVVVGASSQTFTRGQSLRAHGDQFGANDPIRFLLDSTTPVLASNGSVLSTRSDSQGTFDITILVSKLWTTGAHVIAATDTRTRLSAYIDIQVNPVSSPVSITNNTNLAFTLNGQPINHLSFTAQIGQPSPPAQRITFTNITGTPVQWSASASATQNLNWLTILDSDYAGQLDISQPHTMGISVNPTGLAVTPKGKSPYSGQIVFTINGTTQLTLPVQLTIIDATPEMVFSPNPLVVTANRDGTCASGATAKLTFINLGSTVITWSANPDLQNNIKFVNDKGIVTENGFLQPYGMNGDTTVVTLSCNGVKAGDAYRVQVFANSTRYLEMVQIG